MKRNAALALLTIAVTLPMFGADPLAKALADARANGIPYCGEGPDPQSVVCRAVTKTSDAEKLVERIALDLRVSPGTAHAIALTLIPQISIWDDRRMGNEAWTKDRLTLERVLTTEPNRAAVIVALSQCAAAAEHPRARYAEIAPLIGDDSHAAVVAADAIGTDDATEILLGAALMRHPDDVQVIEGIGEHSTRTAVRAAFGPLQMTRSGAHFRLPAASDTAKLRERVANQIQAIANLGLSDALLRAYDALPRTQQQALMTAKTRPDVRPDLAAAAILGGRNSLARRLTDAAKPDAHDDDVAAWELVEGCSPAFSGDPFAIIVSTLTAPRFSGSTLRTLLFARFAEQHGYTPLASELLSDAASYTDITEAPTPFQKETAAVLAEANAAFREEQAHSRQLRPAPADAPGIRSSLARPRLVPFTEHRLEDAGASADSPIIIDCSDAARVAAEVHLPPFVKPIRMERKDDEIAAIAISPALDPVGELGLGGYWALRSTDGGATWNTYYTGLRENMPYVVTPASRLPLLNGDHLRVEVEVQELDTSSITFPPTDLRAKRSQKGLYLDFPWEELTRDSDRDGLTDLVEERLTTDPHEIDTDGDGIPDGEDLLPRVPLRPGQSTVAEVLAAVLDQFALGGGRIVIGMGRDAAGAEIAQNSCEVRTSHVADPVLFIVGDASAFAPLTLGRRTIVLTDEEMDAYTKKFGPTYTARIEHLAINPAGTRAILELNQSWAGATYILTKTEKGWEVTVGTSWIT